MYDSSISTLDLIKLLCIKQDRYNKLPKLRILKRYKLVKERDGVIMEFLNRDIFNQSDALCGVLLNIHKMNPNIILPEMYNYIIFGNDCLDFIFNASAKNDDNIIRDGVVCENNFDKELYDKILNSSLYKYSNLMKQNGLKHSLKNKYIARKTLKDDFYQMSTEQQFQLIKDILYYSLNRVSDNENKKYFHNVKSGNNNEMGNIERMYDLVMNIPYDLNS